MDLVTLDRKSQHTTKLGYGVGDSPLRSQCVRRWKIARGGSGDLLDIIGGVRKVLDRGESMVLSTGCTLCKTLDRTDVVRTATGLALSASSSLSFPPKNWALVSGSNNLYRSAAVAVMEDCLESEVGAALHASSVVIFLRRLGRPSSLPSLLSPGRLPSNECNAPLIWPNVPANAMYPDTWL